MLLASETAVKEMGLTPMVEIVSGSSRSRSCLYGYGSRAAVKRSLQRAGMELKQMDLVELNEAFAAQSLGVIHELKEQHGVDDAWFKTHCNVNGGAIALGHPIGASGNRITVTLIHEMKRRGVGYGLASLCIGGGMGTALILKNT